MLRTVNILDQNLLRSASCSALTTCSVQDCSLKHDWHSVAESPAALQVLGPVCHTNSSSAIPLMASSWRAATAPHCSRVTTDLANWLHDCRRSPLLENLQVHLTPADQRLVTPGTPLTWNIINWSTLISIYYCCRTTVYYSRNRKDMNYLIDYLLFICQHRLLFCSEVSRWTAFFPFIFK